MTAAKKTAAKKTAAKKTAAKKTAAKKTAAKKTAAKKTPSFFASGERTQYTLNQTDGPMVRFIGKKLAEVDSQWRSGVQQTRWMRFRLYQTVGGKYIASSQAVSMWQGEDSPTSIEICATTAEVIAFFGQEDLAQELYRKAAIDNLIWVD